METNKLAFSIAEAVAATSLSRITLWRLAREGRLKTCKVGARTLIPADALRKLLEGEAV